MTIGTANFVKACMGDNWSRWFADGEPLASDVVPSQVCELLLATLDRVKQAWDKQMSTPRTLKAAEAQFGALQNGAKKRKTELEAPAATASA